MDDGQQANRTPMEPVGPTPAGGWKRPWAAYNIIQRRGWKGPIWSRIGSAWLNRDGSITLVLDSFPIGGRINLREDDGDGRRGSQRGALALEAPAETGTAPPDAHQPPHAEA
jgi:hypothetical protein